MPETVNKFGIIVLAAGASTRMGRPKQLLPFIGETLIEHAVRTALNSGADDVTVVVGAEEAVVRAKLERFPVRIIFNGDWQEGMGSSIRRGVAAQAAEVTCLVISPCDQPLVTAELYRELAERQIKTQARIVASSYNGVIGAPCAFGQEMFPKLMALQGDTGARQLIRNSLLPVEIVEFAGGNLDVDTIEDYQSLVDSV